MKRYILIAGVNGAGKSTLYQSLPSLQEMERVNTDELVRAFGNWRNSSDILRAGKIAIRKIHQYISGGVTFNQETTLCGRSILKYIELAKTKGYMVELHYIGVDSVEIAKQRVHHRVLMGGHGVDEELIEKRYRESFANLKIVLNKCDLIAFYDNSESFRRFAIYRNGSPVRLSKNIPEWYEKYVCEHTER